MLGTTGTGSSGSWLKIWSAAYLANLAASWTGYVVTAAVAFVLSPYIVHTLGSAAYGVWSVLSSVTGYLGLLDIGVRVSTGRYLNYYLGRGERDKAVGVVGTSLTLYTAAGFLVIAASVILGVLFPAIFPKLPRELAEQARWILPLMGVTVWLSLYSSVFGQVLIAGNQFRLKNGLDLAVLAVRVAATVKVLDAGAGFVGLAWVTLGATALQTGVLWLAARRVGVVELSPASSSWTTAREVVQYSAWSFVFNAGSRLVSYADTILIAILLGAGDVTVFAIGFMLIDYGGILLAEVVGVMTPDIYKLAGRGDVAVLRETLIVGARRTMFVAIPVLVGFVMLGGDFITLWMGEDYAQSARVLAILSIAQFGTLANRACGAAAWGLGQVKPLAWVKLAEAVVNVTLSVFFVSYLGLGIYGVALGTLVPMVLEGWIFVPVFVCGLLRVPVGDYYRQTMGRWVPVSLAFAGLCWAALSVPLGDGWVAFWVRVTALSLIYLPIGMRFVLRDAVSGGAPNMLHPIQAP